MKAIKRVSFLSRFPVSLIQPRLEQELLIAQFQPWMLIHATANEIADARQEVEPQVLRPDSGVYGVFGVGEAFAVADFGDPVRLCNAEIPGIASIEYEASALVNLRTRRNREVQYYLPVQSVLRRKQNEWRIEFLWLSIAQIVSKSLSGRAVRASLNSRRMLSRWDSNCRRRLSDKSFVMIRPLRAPALRVAGSLRRFPR